MLIKEILIEGLEPGQKVIIPDTIKMPLSARAKQLSKDKNFTKEDLKYFSLIEDVCSDFIKVVKRSNNFLYRGMTSSGDVLYGKSIENRNPKDSEIEVQRVIDKFLKMSGFKALRSNSIFTSSDKQFASGFGTTYVIFPKNGFSYTWNMHYDWIPGRSDIPKGYRVSINFERLVKLLIELKQKIQKPVYEYITEYFYPDGIAKFKQWYKNASNKKQFDIKHANIIKSSKNIHRAFFGYYWEDVRPDDLPAVKNFILELEKFQKLVPGLNYFDFLTSGSKKIYKLIMTPEPTKKDTENEKQIAEKFIKKHKFSKTNLEVPMKSTYEVYIHGEYIAFKAKYYEHKLMEYFQIS